MHPILISLLIVCVGMVGVVVVLSARKIYDFYRRFEERQLASMKNSHALYKIHMTLRQQISPGFLVFNIRACGALVVLFAIALFAIAV